MVGRFPAHFAMFAYLFRDGTGAQTALKAVRTEFAREAVAHQLPERKPAQISGLRSETWALNTGTTAILMWQRANVYFHAVVDCDDDSDCGFKPAAPALAWAAQIDGRAKRLSRAARRH